MKPCPEFSQWRRRFLEQSLTPDETAAFAQHRSRCSACDLAYAQAQTLDALLHLGAERHASEQFNQGVWNRIHARASMPAPRRGWLPAWAGAGLLLFVAAVGFAGYERFHHPSAAQPRMAQAQAAKAQLAAARTDGIKSDVRAAARLEVVAPVRMTVNRAQLAGPVGGQSAQASETPALAATPAAGNRQVSTGVKTAYQPESQAPATKGNNPNNLAGPEKSAAAESPRQISLASATPGLLPGHVQVRPNTIRLGRGERMRLEVNPESTGRLEARIYTREGRLVRTLVDTEVPPGYRCWEWDGANDQQEKAAAGIYFLHVRGNVPEQKFKLAVIR